VPQGQVQPKRVAGRATPLQSGGGGAGAGRRWVARDIAGDESGAAVEGEVEKAPLYEYDDAALEFDDVDQMDEEPDAPGNETGNVDAENIGDGGGAADDSHVAFVEIFERRQRAACKTRFDEFAGVAAALDGDLRDAG